MSIRRIPTTPPTRRELEVLAMSLLMPQKDVAYVLGIRHQTVKDHLRVCVRKLAAADRLHAARMLGWVNVPEELVR